MQETTKPDGSHPVKQCPVCNEVCSNGSSLRRHIVRHAAENGQGAGYDESKMYKCVYCRWQLPPSDFSAHASIHFSEVFIRHKDEIPGKKLMEREDSKLTSPEVRHFVCCRCRKQFRSNEMLRRHWDDRHHGKGTILLAID